MKMISLFRYTFILLLACSLLAGCDDSDDSRKMFPITHAIVPDALSVYVGQKVTFQAQGFEMTDELYLRKDDKDTPVKIAAADASTVTFIIPAGLINGTYSMGIKRNGIEQVFGIVSLNIRKGADIPNKEGATVKGRVHCNGVGISYVPVSDGVNITMTDEEGYYWLESEKYHGYVFITMPSGYEVPVSNALPEFWASLTEGVTICEQHDFELIKVDNNDHIMVVATDMHLANRLSPKDYIQFADGFMPDVKTLARANSGKKVYGMNLGDFSFDVFWYSNSWALAECKETIKTLPFPLFSTMGNHDNDPYCAGDFAAEAAYKKLMGPSYYSFNIGKIHYIMLDNTVYKNLDGVQGKVGARDYDVYVIRMQMEWLKKDLEHVDKTTPIVVGVHCPVYSYSWSGGQWLPVAAFEDENGSNAGSDALTACFAGFNNVQYLTGHTHINRVVPVVNRGGAANMLEHNVAAVCGTWWWTKQYVGNNICKDGSPDGYKVFEMNGENMTWYYKGVGLDKTRQYRSYDMNEVKNYLSADPKAVAFYKANPSRSYSAVVDNTVYLNVWGHDPEKWKISVREGNTELTVTPVRSYDPLHAISYDIPRTAVGSVTESFLSNQSSHLFGVKASSATSTLEITVTDRFGNVFTESMARPKAFSPKMSL